MSFTAQYHGECPRCGNELQGTEARYVGEDVVHVKCPEAAPDDAMHRNERSCGDCFTIHAGDCL